MKSFPFIIGILLGAMLVSIPWYYAWKSEVDEANANFFEAIIEEPEISNLILEETQIKLTESDLNWSFTDVDGKEYLLDDLTNKVVFMNFWATWCVPCIAEFPSLNDLYKKYKDNDQIVFLFLSYESSGKVKRFMKEKAEFNLPFYNFELKSKPNLFSSSGIPTTIIINTKGEMVLKHTGMAHWDSDNVMKLLNDLLIEK